jgi:hypothetical protein
MSGSEAIVLGFIVAAFAIFAVTLGWLSSESGRRPVGTPANDAAHRAEGGGARSGQSIAERASAWQPRRS